jgi:aspartate 1-decarboxylase
MKRTFLKSKIHRASVTEDDLDYEGSLGLDEDLMKAADEIDFFMPKVVLVDDRQDEDHHSRVYPFSGSSGNGC